MERSDSGSKRIRPEKSDSIGTECFQSMSTGEGFGSYSTDDGEALGLSFGSLLTSDIRMQYLSIFSEAFNNYERHSFSMAMQAHCEPDLVIIFDCTAGGGTSYPGPAYLEFRGQDTVLSFLDSLFTSVPDAVCNASQTYKSELPDGCAITETKCSFRGTKICKINGIDNNKNASAVFSTHPVTAAVVATELQCLHNPPNPLLPALLQKPQPPKDIVCSCNRCMITKSSTFFGLGSSNSRSHSGSNNSISTVHCNGSSVGGSSTGCSSNSSSSSNSNIISAHVVSTGKPRSNNNPNNAANAPSFHVESNKISEKQMQLVVHGILMCYTNVNKKITKFVFSH
jgi:hypothetical protein